MQEIEIATDEGPVLLRLVKPCVRCSIPSVEPATGVQTQEPGATLASCAPCGSVFLVEASRVPGATEDDRLYRALLATLGPRRSRSRRDAL